MDTTIPHMDTETRAYHPVRSYIAEVNDLFMSPARFFRELPFNLSQALSFGIISAWLAALISFTVGTVNSFLLTQLFDGWVQRLLSAEEGFSLFGVSATSFIWTAGLLVVGPFIYLIRIFMSSSVLYMFSLLLIEEDELAPEKVTFRAVMRIRATAFASQWFTVVPVFGSVIAFIANLVLVITGVRERFRVSTKRAAVVVLAPYFFLLLALVLLGLLFSVFLLQFPFQDFVDLKAEPWGY